MNVCIECVHVCVCMCVYTCMHSYHVPLCDTGRQKGEEGKEKSEVREAEQFRLAHVGMMTATVALKQGVTDCAEETIPNHSITTEGTSPVEPSCRLNFPGVPLELHAQTGHSGFTEGTGPLHAFG